MSAENQHFCPQKFKFFRVLLRDFSTTLALPQAPRLTNHFIKENLTYVTLLSPIGAKSAWNVRIGGDSKLGLHFAEGWERFAAAHRLSFGDFLVFKYIGSTLFQVTIFDKSTCEKDCYNYNIASDDVPAGDDQGENGGHQKEYSECFRKQTTPSSSGERSISPPILMQQESNKARDERSACKRKALQKPVHDHKAKDQRTEQQGGKRGSHFEITMTPKCKYAVIIPVKFARSNGLSSVHQMLLRDPSGRGGPWLVTLYHCKRSIRHDRYSLSAGWRDFCIGNDLKDGDVCVFELKKKNEMTVHIRRSCEEDGSRRSKCRLQQLVPLKRAPPVQPKGSPSKVARTSKQEANSTLQFKSTILPSNLCKYGYLNIPKAFHSSVDLSAEKEAIFVDPNYQRRWPVKIHHNPKRGRCWAGQGWEAFCEKNGVEIGDQCVFSFKYRGREATFHVEVIKSKAAEHTESIPIISRLVR